MPQGPWETEVDPEPMLFDDDLCNSVLKDLELLPTVSHSADKISSLFGFDSDLDVFITGLLLEGDTGWEHGWNHEKTSDLDFPMDSFPNLEDLEKEMNEKFTSAVSQCSLLADFENGIGENGGAHITDSTCPQLEPDGKVEQSSSEDEESICTGSLTLSSSESEEEIDVVTVERHKTVGKRTVCTEQIRRSETRAQRLAAIKRCNLEIQLQHNYAAPCPTTVEAKRPCTYTAGFKGVRKRKNFDLDEEEPQRTHALFKCANKSRSQSMRSSSDVEEEERRRTHNVLERQRRNELKLCFLKLRDEVPDLLNKEKASKVVILQQARDFITSLQVEERKCISSREKLKRKQEQLRRRLEHLKRTK